MIASQGIGQTLVVPRQAAEAVDLGKIAFRDPAPGQEATLHLRVLDDLHLAVLPGGRRSGLIADIALG